jgi:hypothetical protein
MLIPIWNWLFQMSSANWRFTTGLQSTTTGQYAIGTAGQNGVGVNSLPSRQHSKIGTLQASAVDGFLDG